MTLKEFRTACEKQSSLRKPWQRLAACAIKVREKRLEKLLFRRKNSFGVSFDEQCLAKSLRDFGAAYIELKEACRQKHVVVPPILLNEVCMLYSA